MLLFWDPWEQIASPSQNPLCPIIQCLIIGMSCVNFQSFCWRLHSSQLMWQLQPDIDSVVSSSLPLRVPFSSAAIVVLICCISPLRGCNLLLKVQLSSVHGNCSAVRRFLAITVNVLLWAKTGKVLFLNCGQILNTNVRKLLKTD